MTLDEFRAVLDRVGIAPEPEELAELHAAWTRMEAGRLAVLRRNAGAGAG